MEAGESEEFCVAVFDGDEECDGEVVDPIDVVRDLTWCGEIGDGVAVVFEYGDDGGVCVWCGRCEKQRGKRGGDGAVFSGCVDGHGVESPEVEAGRWPDRTCGAAPGFGAIMGMQNLV